MASCIATAATVSLGAGATAVPASHSSAAALLTYVDARGELCGMRADGSHRVRLANSRTSAPAWSADGRHVAFDRATHRSIQVFVADARGHVHWHFALSGYNAGRPLWAPDGRHIAYDFGSAYRRGLAIARPDGSDDHEIAPNAPGALPPDEPSDPAWTPDGRRFAFVDQASSKAPQGIYSVNVDGSDRQLLVPNAIGPAFSPDGSKLAYVAVVGASLGGIYIADADGSNPRALALSPRDDAPTWSPDGTRIAFLRGSSIVVVDPDGSREHVIASGARAFPVWSPDSRLIAFMRGPSSIRGNRPFTSMLVVARADGGGERVVLRRHSSIYVQQPAWRPAAALPVAKRPRCTGT